MMHFKNKSRSAFGVCSVAGLCAAVMLSLCSPAVSYGEEPDEAQLYSKAAALVDGDTGRVLYGKNADTVMPMASTTKIMTCIIALEYASEEDIYTVSSYAASMPAVKAGYRKDEQYALKDLLYALMLESHNDAAVVIAEGVAGSVEGFAALMNQKAAEIGCTATNFVTPNGLDAQGHQTTAAELGKIASYALENERFCEIIQTRNHTYTSVSGGQTHSITNKNAFLDQYEGCIGMKTGYTGKAGYCYVGCARRDGETLISVVLACGWPPHKTYKWQDCRTLLNYGFEEFQMQEVLTPKKSFETIVVNNGIQDTITVSTTDSLTLLMGESEQVRVEYSLPDCIEAPVAAGEQIGTMELFFGDTLYETYPVQADQSVGEFTWRYALDVVLKYFLDVEYWPGLFEEQGPVTGEKQG